MANVLDTFTRANADVLGTSDSGHAWQQLRGTTVIRGGRAVPVASNALSVVDAGAGGQDATLQLEVGTSGGHALCFRVVDANNYWRATVRHYSYQYQSGSQQVFSHYESQFVGYTTEYEYGQTYQSDFGIVNGIAAHNDYATSPTMSAPYFPPTSPNDPYGRPKYGGAFYNRQVQVPQYQQVPIYTTQPVYSTAWAYDVRLDRIVGGAITNMLSRSVGEQALSQLKVVARGQSISLYSSASPTTAHGAVNDSTHSQATKHGIGYAETSEATNNSGVDQFTVTPDNIPPGSPTLLAPLGNETVNLGQPQTFRLAARDTDPGDAISRTEWEWQLVSGGTVLSASQQSADPTITRPAGTFVAGAWRWRARTYDRAGAQGPWSGYEFFTAGNPPNAPTITEPTNNGTIAYLEDAPLSWTTANQDAFEVAVYADLNGAPNLDAPLLMPAVTEGATARTTGIDRPVNNRVEHTRLRIRYQGLWSEPAWVKSTVLWTPPAEPYLALALDVRRGYMLATLSHPTPVGSQPAVQYGRLWRRRAGKTREVLVASNLGAETFVDATVGHRVDYEYRAEAVSASGVTSSTPWLTSASSEEAVVRPAAPVLQSPATEVTASSFRSSWQPVPNATAYLVQRRDLAGTWVLVETLPAATTTYVHSGLLSTATYEVRVIARNGLVLSDPSTVVATTTIATALTRVSAARSSTWRVRRRIEVARATTWNVASNTVTANRIKSGAGFGYQNTGEFTRYEAWRGTGKLDYMLEFQSPDPNNPPAGEGPEWRLMWPFYMRNAYPPATTNGRKLMIGASLSSPSYDGWNRVYSWQQMAAVGTPDGQGPMDAGWARFAQRLVADGQGDCELRGAHELNLGAGDVAVQRVEGSETEHYKAAFRRQLRIMRANGFTGRVGWNIIGERDGMTLYWWEDSYPGDDVVDMLMVDVYDGWYNRGWDPGNPSTWPTAAEKAAVRAHITSTLNTVRQFAVAHNLKIGVPEWGLRLWREGNNMSHGGGDHPEFIHMMFDWFTDPAYPPGAPGGVVFECFWEWGSGAGVYQRQGETEPGIVPVPNSRAAFLDRARKMAAGSSGPVPTKPGTPTLADATNITSQGFTLSWSAASNATDYLVQIKQGTGSYATIGTVTGTSYAVTGQQASSVYVVRVIARNGSVSGDPSNERTVTTTAAVAGTPITLGWTGKNGSTVTRPEGTYYRAMWGASGNVEAETTDPDVPVTGPGTYEVVVTARVGTGDVGTSGAGGGWWSVNVLNSAGGYVGNISAQSINNNNHLTGTFAPITATLVVPADMTGAARLRLMPYWYGGNAGDSVDLQPAATVRKIS